SGVVGVTHVVSKSPKGTVYEYWQAAWVDADDKRKTAKFSITRYGSEKALDLAKKARKAGVKGKR
ncbi:MAG: AP2 domain-containing protein, partial [Verrucomicrobiales bacterium]|nr:AP2 domain-containing protein [Verrucomicrobiales bacterium]